MLQPISRLIVLCILYLGIVQLCRATPHLYQHLKEKLLSQSYDPEALTPDNTEKGFIMCAGNHMVPDVLKMVWQLKHQWRSAYGISVAHCGEISNENQEVLRTMHPGIRILNLCTESTVLGMSQKQAHYRLRGFNCKVAAMIMSPFSQTMLLDLDVVWFQSPDLLFNSKAFNDTGAVFFRDRTYPAGANHKTDDQILLEMFNEKDIGVTDDDVKKLSHSNGENFYWLYIASKKAGGKSFPQFSDLQDSSVVLLNRATHPNMLKVLTEMVPSFDYGYGDKELFWISATIAKESFMLSPFLAGQYGDCHGVILHYHPDDANKLDTAQPLYTNAEYFVEKDTTSVGDWLGQTITPPLLASAVLNVTGDMVTWGKKRGDLGCTCKVYPCVPAPSSTKQKVLYAQWLTLTMRLSRAGPEKDCVPVKVAACTELAAVLQTELTSARCYFAGCPQLPIKVDTELTWSSGRYCDPVHFASTLPEGLEKLALEARRPDSEYNRPAAKDNTPIQCDNEKQLFLYVNNTLRPFNSWGSFVNRGFDLDNVVKVCTSL